MVYLPHDISSICKMFADDTALSSLSLSDLNYELETINQWARQRKILIPALISKHQKFYFLTKETLMIIIN